MEIHIFNKILLLWCLLINKIDTLKLYILFEPLLLISKILPIAQNDPS